MMSSSTLPASPSTHLTWRTVLDAWRGITRTEIATSFLFGLCYFLYETVVYMPVLLSSEDLVFHFATLSTTLHRFASAQIAAFGLIICIVVADRVTDAEKRQPVPYVLAVVVSGALVIPLLTAIAMATSPEAAQQDKHFLLWSPLHDFFEWLILAGAAIFVYTDRRRARIARERMHAAELERARTAKRTLESRLQAMQARVEPTFLFNTLSQVRDLYRADVAHGERMLDELIAYLRAAMPKMRDTSSTIGQEIELVRAYLGIVSVRLCERLVFQIERIDQRIADARMPPMMLLPLVDHAIAHGLAASQATRTLRIHTGIAEGKIRLEIADSGVGFLPETERDAIAGIRERLAALYGDAARLELRRIDATVSTAMLEIPLQAAPRQESTDDA